MAFAHYEDDGIEYDTVVSEDFEDIVLDTTATFTVLKPKEVPPYSLQTLAIDAFKVFVAKKTLECFRRALANPYISKFKNAAILQLYFQNYRGISEWTREETWEVAKETYFELLTKNSR